MARIRTGKLERRKEVVVLRTVVRQAIRTARTQIDDRRHRLTVSLHEGPVRLEADPSPIGCRWWP